MVRVTTFKTIPGSISRRIAIVSYVAEVPASKALYGSELHQFNPGDRPINVNFALSRYLDRRGEEALNPHHIKSISHGMKLTDTDVAGQTAPELCYHGNYLIFNYRFIESADS